VYIVAKGECRVLKSERVETSEPPNIESSGDSPASEAATDRSRIVLQGDDGTYACKKGRQRQVGHLGMKGIAGDIANLLSIPQPSTVITTTTVEVLRFSASDFMNHVPAKMQRELAKMAQQRHQWANSRAAGNYTVAGSDTTQKILSKPLRDDRGSSFSSIQKRTRTKLGTKAKPITSLTKESVGPTLIERAMATNVGSISYSQQNPGTLKSRGQSNSKRQGATAGARNSAITKKSVTASATTSLFNKSYDLPVGTICRNPKHHCNGMSAAMFPPLSKSTSMPGKMPSRESAYSVASLAGRKPVVVGRSKGFADALNRPHGNAVTRKPIRANLDSSLSTQPVHMVKISDYSVMGNTQRFGSSIQEL